MNYYLSPNIYMFVIQNTRNMISGEISPDKAAADDSAPKRIVHKLRSDVKVPNLYKYRYLFILIMRFFVSFIHLI